MTLEATSISNVGKEARQRFERDGFLILDNPVSTELVDGLRSEFEAMFKDRWHDGAHAEADGVVYDGPGRETAEWHWHRIKNAWKISDNARAVALDQGILDLLEDLYGRAVLPFQTLNFPVGTQQKAHADSFHFQSDPVGYMCGVWIALEDMDMENGPLVYYPGSHKLPIPTWPEIEAEMGERLDEKSFASRSEFLRARSAQYERYCQRLIERENLQPEYGTIRQGQAVLWASNLLHGGSPQTDKSRTRHSQVTHYFFEGCRVFTPLHTDGDHNFWYYPEWIRDPVPAYSQTMLEETIASHVPEGSEVLFLSDGELPQVAGRSMTPFPQDDDGQFAHLPDDQAIGLLEDRRSRGARFIVIPRERLQFFVYSMPALQDHIEERYTSLVRDGSVCAIYALDR
jgi:ectoine hydroxylase-related dioxygenase (phytanoyl-CoA dioxygenase family)